MKKELISFETAKLAKLKGFDVPTLSAYIGNVLFTLEPEPNGYDGFDVRDECDWNNKGWVYTNNGYSAFGPKADNVKYFEGYSAPTQSLLQKWIRETRGVHIEIYRNASGWYWSMRKSDGGTNLGWSEQTGPNAGGVWNSYESALEFALQVQLSYDLPNNTNTIGHWGNYVDFALIALASNQLTDEDNNRTTV